MQFRQAIYTNNLYYELSGVKGVRTINYVELTQNFNDLYNQGGGIGSESSLLYCYDANY